MAIWHYRLSFLPKNAVTAMVGEVPASLPEIVLYEEPWWDHQQPPREYASWFTEVLPEVASWSSSMRIWGPKDGHGISVSYTGDGKIKWISIKIDARLPTNDFIESVCAISKRAGWVLATLTGEIFQPDVFQIETDFRNSLAFRFTLDPRSALQSLR